MKAKIFDVQNLLWLALALALAGSLKHLAAIFANVDGNISMGWLQAVAIDAGLFALAYSIRLRKVAKRSTKILWFGVAMFTTISIYGNLSYGLLATGGSLPGWIVATKPYILAGSLPILVLFLSELLSDDRQHAAKEAEKEAKKLAKSSKLPPTQPELAIANEARIATKEQRKRHLATLHSQKPDATITELATALDVSRGTVRNYANELGLELATNGNGKGA
jgi:hypothetical protein